MLKENRSDTELLLLVIELHEQPFGSRTSPQATGATAPSSWPSSVLPPVIEPPRNAG